MVFISDSRHRFGKMQAMWIGYLLRMMRVPKVTIAAETDAAEERTKYKNLGRWKKSVRLQVTVMLAFSIRKSPPLGTRVSWLSTGFERKHDLELNKAEVRYTVLTYTPRWRLLPKKVVLGSILSYLKVMALASIVICALSPRFRVLLLIIVDVGYFIWWEIWGCNKRLTRLRWTRQLQYHVVKVYGLIAQKDAHSLWTSCTIKYRSGVQSMFISLLIRLLCFPHIIFPHLIQHISNELRLSYKSPRSLCNPHSRSALNIMLCSKRGSFGRW